MKKLFTLRILILVIAFGIGGKSWGQIAAWDFTGAATPATFAATTFNSNLVIASGANNITRGAGAAASAGANSFRTVGFQNNGIAVTNTDYFQITLTALAGFNLSLSTIDARFAGTASYCATPGVSSQFAYSLDGTTFTLIGAPSITIGTPATLTQIDVSAISALQNVAAGTTVTLRYYASGQTATGGWGFNSPASGNNGLAIGGSLASTSTPSFNITSSFTTFSTTVGIPSAQQSYTISGLNLTPNQTNGISVTAPANFEVSLTSNTFTGTNGNTVTLSSNGTGNIVGEPVTIYVRYFPAASGTTTANIAHSGAGVSPAQNLSVTGVSTAYYYSKASGSLTTPATFNTAADGSGTDAVNFTANNQTFEIRNRTTATIAADWTVSGTSSKIVVGNGVDFTIPSTNFVAGTVDVLGTGKLTLQNSTLPVIGTLATGSTVEYAQTTATSILNTTTDAVTYSNLKLSGSGLKTFKNATTTVTGNLTYDGTTNGPLAIEAASVATFTTINLGGNLTYLGTVTNPVDADSYTLVTTATGTQTITANNNVPRFFRLTASNAGNNVLLSSAGGTTNLLLGNLTGGGLTLNTGTTLTLNGNTATFFAGNNTVTGAGTITGSATSNLVINKTGAAVFGTLNFTNGARMLNNLTINNTATTPTVTLGTALDIYGVLTVNAGQLVSGTNNLTLKSISNAATARVETGSAAGNYISGTNIAVERYIDNTNTGTAGRRWHLLSGVTTTTLQTIRDSWQDSGRAQGANPGYGTWVTAPGSPAGYDAASPNNSSILTHNPATPAWVTPAVTNSAALSSEQGYMLFVRGDRSADGTNTINNPTVLRVTGTLNQGTQAAIPILNTRPGYTLVGNPFASPIDLENILTTTNLSQLFQVWDATVLGNNNVGKFRVVQKTGAGAYTATPSTGGNDNTLRYIHSGQAFFLKTNGSGDASVVIAETDKTNLLSVVNPIVQGGVNQQIYTELAVINAGNTETVADAVRVWYNNAFTASITDDILKIGNFGENISSYRSGQKFIVENRPMITDRDTIFLRSSNLAVSNYRFKINTFDFVQNNLQAFLSDKYINRTTVINLDGSISNVDFSVTSDPASADPDRFMIVFASNKPVPASTTSLQAAQQNNQVAVEWKVTNQSGIARYEVEKSTDGVNFTKVNTQTASTATDATYNWLDANPVTGNNYYRLRSMGVGGEVKISQVVTVTMGKGIASSIFVYPNPVVNKTVTVLFTNMDKGMYRLRLLTIGGGVLSTITVNHSGGNAVQKINLPNGITAGSYKLEVIKPGSNRTIISVMILQ